LEYSTEILERFLVGFEKSLLRGSPVREVKSAAAGHAAHAEHPELLAHPIYVPHRLVPVDLSFHAPRIALWHENLAASVNPVRVFADPHAVALSIRQHRFRAAPVVSVSRSGERCAAAFAGSFDPPPKSHR